MRGVMNIIQSIAAIEKANEMTKLVSDDEAQLHAMMIRKITMMVMFFAVIFFAPVPSSSYSLLNQPTCQVFGCKCNNSPLSSPFALGGAICSALAVIVSSSLRIFT
jgi:hypothetical protein